MSEFADYVRDLERSNAQLNKEIDHLLKLNEKSHARANRAEVELLRLRSSLQSETVGSGTGWVAKGNR